MVSVKCWLLVFIFLIFPTKTHSFDYGSDTAVSIQNPVGISGKGNIIKTFAFCNNGFSYLDPTTTCSWQSIFPVTGEINLAGGDLYLLNDLTLNNIGSFKDFGTIYGAGHRLNLSENFKTFGVSAASATQKVLGLISRVTTSREIYSADWSYDGNYLAVSVSTGFGNDLLIYSFSGSTLTLLTGFNYGGAAYDVKWHPNSYFIATTSSSTSYKINLFQFTPPSTLTRRNSQNPTGTFYSIAWNGPGNRIAAGGTTLTTYRFNTATNVYDTQITPTNTGALDGDIRANALRWAPRGSKEDLIAVTNNVGTTGSMHLYNFTGAALDTLKSYNLGLAANCMDWAATSTYVVVGFANSTIKSYQHSAENNAVVYKNNYNAPTAVNSLSWNIDGVYLVAGYALAASDNEFALLSINDTTYALRNEYVLDLTTAVNVVRFCTGQPNYVLRGDATTRYLSVYRLSDSPFKLVDTHLYLNSDLDLGAPLTFVGDCSIVGGGHKIAFSDAGSINLDQDSTITIQLTKLNFNDASSFALQGQNSVVTFKDTDVLLDHDVTWGDGSFKVYGDLIITGAHNFNYDTAYTSTIFKHSNLNLQNGCIFSLGKASLSETREPLDFQDLSASLNLEDSTLNIKNYGFTVKRGTIQVSGDSTFDIDYSDTTLSSTTQAFQLGDGVNPSNDAILKLAGSSTRLTVTNGSIVLADVLTTSMAQILGQPVVDLQSDKMFYVKKPFVLSGGEILTSPSGLFYVDPAAYFTTEGTIYSLADGTLSYKVTGTTLSSYEILLDQNDSIQLFNGNFPLIVDVVSDGNVISGQGNFSGVLNFTDQNTTLSWDIPAILNPVSDIDLKGGKIIFTQNAGFADAHAFAGTGTVDLIGTTFNLPPQYADWTGNIYWIGNGATMRFNGEQSLSGIWTFSGSVILDGNGYTLDLGTSGTIILERGAQVEFKNISLYNLSRKTRIICKDDSCSITLNFSDLVLSDDYLFETGSIYFYYDSDIMTQGVNDRTLTFTYASTQTSTIDAVCIFEVYNNIRFSIGRANSIVTNSDQQPLVFGDPITSKLVLRGGTLRVTSSGMIMTRGVLDVTDSSNLEIENTAYPYGLVLGDGIAGNDFDLKIEAGTQLTLKSGRFFYNNSQRDEGVIFGSPESALAVESMSGLFAKTDLTLSRGSISMPTADFTVTGKDPGVFITYVNMHRYDYSHTLDFFMTGTAVAEPSPTIVLDSNDMVLVNPGTLNRDIDVCQYGNYVTGVGNISGSINFTDWRSTLTWDMNNQYSAGDIDLKGGRIIFTQDSGIGPQYSFKGSGTIDLTTKTLELGTAETTWIGNFYWIGDGGIIRMNNDVTLDGVWTISGNVTLDGNGYSMDLGTTGTIILERGAQLTFNNFALYNMTRQNGIFCTDNNCLITLNYVDFVLAGDFLFDKGGIYVYYDSIMMPISPDLDRMFTFSYASTMPFEIDSDSSIDIWSGLRFSIGRQDSTITDPDEQPLIFYDPGTAKFILNGGTLHITSSGMILTKGTIDVASSSNLEIETPKYEYGLVFGDGTPSNDFLLNVDAGIQLTLKSGKMYYNNYQDNRIVLNSPASVLAVEPSQGLVAKENLTLSLGSFASPLPSDISLAWDPGIIIKANNIHRFDYGHLNDYYITGTLTPPILLLDSNDQILTNPGTLSKNIEIIQYGNKLTGVGNIGGQIIFTDWRSTLTWDINNQYSAGDIDLKGGRIIFTQDSGIGPQYSFKGSGTIDLTTKTLELGTAETTWIGNFYWIGDGGIIRMNNDVTLDGVWTISGNITLEGNGYSMDLGTTGTIILERGAQLTFNNFALYNMTRQNGIFCSDNNCLITLNYVDLILADDFLFDKGSIYVYYDSIIMPYAEDLDAMFTFSYASTAPMEIDSDASLAIWPGLRLSIGRQDSTVTDTTLQPLIFYDPLTSRLILDGGTLHVTSSGMIMTFGTINVARSSEIEVETPKFEYGLVLGDGVPEDDFLLDIGAGVQLSLMYGKIYYNNYYDNRIVFNSPASNLLVDINNGLFAKRNLTITDGTLSTPLVSNVPVGRDPGIFIVYKNVNRYDISHILDFYITGTARVIPTPATILDSNDKLLINPGAFDRPIVVYQYGNLVSGIGNMSGTIDFTDWRSSLTWDINNQYSAADIDLNGGRIIYTQDSGIGDGHSFVGTGTVDLTNRMFTLGTDDTTWVGNLYWLGDGATIVLNSNVTIDGSWTLSGNITIEGNNYLIDLAPTGSIILERGAHVTFKDFSVYDMSRQNPITCMDNDCQIKMNVADFVLADNYLFDKGSIFVYYNSSIGLLDGLDGVYTFSYASTQTSTIDSFCFLKIRPNMRFSIGRRDSTKVDPGQQPLVFVDPLTSQLILDGGTLHVTSSGMMMTSGRLDVINSSNLEVENTVYPYGLILGDGTAENDFELELMAGNQLVLKSGKIFYNNYSPDRIVFDSRESSLGIDSIDGLTAKKNLTLSNGTLLFPGGDNLAYDVGVSLIQYNVIHRHSSPHSVQILTTHGINPYWLEDGDAFYVAEGLDYSDIVCASGTSSFGGVAGFAGNVNLRNDTVTLNSSLIPAYFNNIALAGGTMNMYNDASFAGDKAITGSGKVNLLGTKLSLGTQDSTMTSTILWNGLSSGTLNFYAKMGLSSTWAFGGNMKLNGNGNVLDLANGGMITIRPNSVLAIENISIKGLGTGKGRINFMDDTSILRLTNSNFELDNDFSTTIGGIFIDGPSIIALKEHNWTIDQNASMTIDRVTLWQDPLDKVNHGKIKFGSGSIGKYLTLVSSGTIKTMANLDVLVSDTTVLQTQIKNNSNAIVYWTPINRTTSNAVNYWSPLNKGTSNAVKFLADHFITINGAKFYTINGISGTSNITDRSIVDGDINLGGGTLTLGGDMWLSSNASVISSGNLDLNGYSIIFDGNLSLPSGINLKILSNGVIDGSDNNLNLLMNGKFIVDSGVTLTLKNMNLIGQSSWPIEMRSASSKLTLQDLIMSFDRDFTFSQGQLFVQGDVCVTGTNMFSYASTGTSVVASHSTLYIDNNTTFSYSPRLEGRHALSERNLIKFLDKTSAIYFDGCTLQLPDSGWQLTRGTVYFDNRVSINAPTDQAHSFEWGDGTLEGEPDIELLAGASVDVNGYIDDHSLN